MRFTLTNSYHRTAHTVRLRATTIDEAVHEMEACERAARDGDTTAKRRIDRAWRSLCGAHGCTCGDRWGRRS